MLPGPEQIIACPECKELAKYRTLLSGNTFGARVWTDGKQIAPEFPLPPAVVKCGQCGECYWLEEAEEVGTVGGWGGKVQRIKAPAKAEEVQEPTEEEYYRALEKGLAKNREQETHLRVLAWWRRNDALRGMFKWKAKKLSDTPGPWRENLEALVLLLDEEDENNALMKAEALRELGRFDSAKEVLCRVHSSDHATVVGQLRSLCDSSDTRVRELRFGA